MVKKRKVIREILSWLMVIIIPFVLIFFLNMKVFAISAVEQSSMENTFFEGKLVYYNRINYTIQTVERGDIILFLAGGRIKDGFSSELAINAQDFADKSRQKSQRINERLVKRVIGIPGDIIDIHDGVVYINGVRETGEYVLGTTWDNPDEYPLTVPPGKLFVLGDNREVSIDSRSFGCIDERSVEGKAIMILWPPSRFGKPEQ